MFIVTVTGGRDYDDVETVAKTMRGFVDRAGRSNVLVVHGGAPGLDTLVETWCNDHGIPCVGMNAPWNWKRKAAGPIRNQWMIDYLKPTHGIVFPGGRGTADMHERMRRAKLTIKVVKQ